MFNDDLSNQRQSESAPVPEPVGLMIHSKTRKGKPVYRMVSEGLSITYKRVTDIRRSASKQVCNQYQEGMFVHTT